MNIPPPSSQHTNAMLSAFVALVPKGTTLTTVGRVEQFDFNNGHHLVVGHCFTEHVDSLTALNDAVTCYSAAPSCGNMSGRFYAGNCIESLTTYSVLAALSAFESAESAITSPFFHEVLADLRLEKELRAVRGRPRIILTTSFAWMDLRITVLRDFREVSVLSSDRVLFADTFLPPPGGLDSRLSEISTGCFDGSWAKVEAYVDELMKTHPLPIINHPVEKSCITPS